MLRSRERVEWSWRFGGKESKFSIRSSDRFRIGDSLSGYRRRYKFFVYFVLEVASPLIVSARLMRGISMPPDFVPDMERGN